MARDSSAAARPETSRIPSEAPSPGPPDVETPEVLLRQGYRFALSLTHDPDRAEDLLQDSWVAVLRARGPWTAAYLITAIRTRFVDEHRRSLIAPTEPLDADAGIMQVESELWNESYPSIRRKRLHDALALLRPEERAVLLLSAVEGYTAREIGALLDAPRGTVLSLMHRTRAKMRRLLDDRLAPEE